MGPYLWLGIAIMVNLALLLLRTILKDPLVVNL
jgi:hypothetical protein